MDPSNPPAPQGSQRKQPGRMSPPSSTGADGDALPPENDASNEQARPGTPPVPLLRPAQGAWEKAYAFGKQQTQSRGPPGKESSPPAHPRDQQPKTSPSSNTRSRDREQGKRRDPSYAPQEHGAPQSRVTHPESAQRHSQASGLVASTSGQPPSYPPAPREHEPRPSSDHYRHAAYGHPTNTNHGRSPSLPPPQYQHPSHPPDPPPPRSSHQEHQRPQTSQLYTASTYYPSPGTPYAHASSATSHYAPQRPPYSEPDPYAPVPRNQTSGYPGMSLSYPQDDPAPVVVLLMEDIRCPGPEPDYQLAEVSVALRPQVGEDQGWWADGEEVMKALQLTPSRLEGAAKVFARRGKYRQCFVRFSEDGVMECQPSSLMVSREKTIELIIEPNMESRTPLPPPPPDAYPRPYASPAQPRGAYEQDYGHYPHAHAYPSAQYYLPSPNSNHTGKRGSAEIPADEHPAAKRPKTSPASPAKRAGPARQHASSQSRPGTSAGGGGSSATTLTQPTPNTRLSSPEDGAQDPISPYGPFQRHESLPIAVKAPKEVVNAAIVAYLRSHIQNEDGYIEFAASKGRLLPIPDLLKGYRFATRIVNTWANRKTPPTVEGCPNKRITKNHVLQALFRQTSWGSDCEQTLQLADKYGPGGQREDPRVVEILSGGSMLPEKSGDKTQGRSQGSVALLDFLKDVDKDHKAKQEEELRKSSSSGGKDPNESGRGEGDGD